MDEYWLGECYLLSSCQTPLFQWRPILKSPHYAYIVLHICTFLEPAWIHLHDLKFKTYSVHWCSTFCLKHSALVPVSLKPEFLKCLHGLVSSPSLLWLVSHLVSQKYNTQFHNCVLAPEAYCKEYYIYGNNGVVIGSLWSFIALAVKNNCVSSIQWNHLASCSLRAMQMCNIMT